MSNKHKLAVTLLLFFCTLFLLLLAGRRIRTLQNQVDSYSEQCGDRTDAPGHGQ